MLYDECASNVLLCTTYVWCTLCWVLVVNCVVPLDITRTELSLNAKHLKYLIFFYLSCARTSPRYRCTEFVVHNVGNYCFSFIPREGGFFFFNNWCILLFDLWVFITVPTYMLRFIDYRTVRTVGRSVRYSKQTWHIIILSFHDMGKKKSFDSYFSFGTNAF